MPISYVRSSLTHIRKVRIVSPGCINLYLVFSALLGFKTVLSLFSELNTRARLAYQSLIKRYLGR